MFLSRLNGEPIGFSVLGIFVIDKNTILTVKAIVTCTNRVCGNVEQSDKVSEVIVCCVVLGLAMVKT